MAIRTLGSRYLLDEQIGQGGMGVVWRGRDKVTGTPFAIKLLRSEYAADPDAVTRFVRERTVLMKFRHPAVVSLHDMIVEGDQLALVMDLVGGGDLNAYRLRSGGTLANAEAARIAAQICDGLAAAHAAGIIHRDLKPANVLLDAGQVKLADFGVARIVGDQSGTTTGTVLGTAAYLAPELLTGSEPSPACDVYAFGITLYEVLAGKPPFNGHVAAIMHDHLKTAPARLPGVPRELWDLLNSCLDKDPARRMTAADMASALRDPGLLAVLAKSGASAPSVLPSRPATSAMPGPPPPTLVPGPPPPSLQSPPNPPPGNMASPLVPVDARSAGARAPEASWAGAPVIPIHSARHSFGAPAGQASEAEQAPAAQTTVAQVPATEARAGAEVRAGAAPVALAGSAPPPALPEVQPSTGPGLVPDAFAPGPWPPRQGPLRQGPPQPGSAQRGPSQPGQTEQGPPQPGATRQGPPLPPYGSPFQGPPPGPPADPVATSFPPGGYPVPQPAAPAPRPAPRRTATSRKKRTSLSANPALIGGAAVVVLALVAVGVMALASIGPFASGHKPKVVADPTTSVSMVADPGRTATPSATPSSARPSPSRSGHSKKPGTKKSLPAVTPNPSTSAKSSGGSGSGGGSGPHGPDLAVDGTFADPTLSSWNYGAENAALDPGAGVNGQNAARLTATPQAGIAETITGISPGKYVLSGYIQASSSPLYIGERNDATGKEVDESAQPAGWEKLSVDFTVPSGQNSAVIFCVQQKGGSGLCSDMTVYALRG